MEKRFYRMSPDDLLIRKLKNSSWWRDFAPLLKQDKDINVQVRGRYLSIYYKMNSIFKIQLDEHEQVSCVIHYKFVPLIKKSINLKHKLGIVRRSGVKKPQENCYVSLTLNGDSLSLPIDSQYEYEVIDKGLLEPGNFKLLKDQIAKYASEEKSYQSMFISKNAATILDAEVAFNEREQKILQNGEDQPAKLERTRIDLLNYDKNRKEIIAIELKMILDKRLHNGEIDCQLKRYISFLKKKEMDLRKAYENVRDVKLDLGLLSSDSLLSSVNFKEIKIVSKPLLVVVCYERALIENFRNQILKAVKDSALGVFFFGSVGDLNLPLKKDNNKVLF